MSMRLPRLIGSFAKNRQNANFIFGPRPEENRSWNRPIAAGRQRRPAAAIGRTQGALRGPPPGSGAGSLSCSWHWHHGTELPKMLGVLPH